MQLGQVHAACPCPRTALAYAFQWAWHCLVQLLFCYGPEALQASCMQGSSHVGLSAAPVRAVPETKSKGRACAVPNCTCCKPLPGAGLLFAARPADVFALQRLRNSRALDAAPPVGQQGFGAHSGVRRSAADVQRLRRRLRSSKRQRHSVALLGLCPASLLPCLSLACLAHTFAAARSLPGRGPCLPAHAVPAGAECSCPCLRRFVQPAG